MIDKSLVARLDGSRCIIIIQKVTQQQAVQHVKMLWIVGFLFLREPKGLVVQLVVDLLHSMQYRNPQQNEISGVWAFGGGLPL